LAADNSSFPHRVPYQFDPSIIIQRSSPSSNSDRRPFVDLSRGVFHSLVLIFSFLKVFFHSRLQADLLELWPLVVWQSLAVVLVSAADYVSSIRF